MGYPKAKDVMQSLQMSSDSNLRLGNISTALWNEFRHCYGIEVHLSFIRDWGATTSS